MRSGVCLLAAISWLSWISSLSAGGDLEAAADRSAIEVKNPLADPTLFPIAVWLQDPNQAQVHSRSRVLPPGRPRRCWASSDASPSRKDGSRTTSGPMTCISTRSRLTDRLLHQESWQRRLPTWSRSSSRSRSRVRIAGMRLRTPPLYRRLEIGVPTWWIRTERGLVSTGF